MKLSNVGAIPAIALAAGRSRRVRLRQGSRSWQ